MGTLLKSKFEHQGYAVIKQGIEPELLSHLQQHAQSLLRDTKELAMQGRGLMHIALSQYKDDSSVSRINNLFEYQLNFARLLTHPTIIGAAELLIGEPVLPVYESMVIKNTSSNEAFDWHRDMQARADDTTIITMGIYLDDSLAEQGALKVIPRSHLILDSVSECKDRLQLGNISSQDIAVQAGDIVIHHVNTVHGSDKQQASHLRRTIYFQFRSLSHLRSNPRFNVNWLEKRQQLFEQLKVKPLKKIDTEIIVLPVGFYDEQVKIEAAEYSFVF
ncbi:phytanoyl-CoA dioxygenase family protein [Pseudoalteromonas aurantia]|uniref:Phytanoyl-CoA dioxygenase n=2 Tax=Pseudoalteromonas TaxID=53246 RepID=A0ABY2W2Y6_9GAMM|nr:phytanoyl-CoA dioxygenase family protein [Pseudoalteromonas aurantia]TMO78758.1 hypothetical protein CWC20_00970 [Pseudoalteromonas aurantia]